MTHPKLSSVAGTSSTRLIHEYSAEYNETCRYVARSVRPQPPLLKEIGKHRNPGYTPAVFAVQCVQAGVPYEHLARLGHTWFTFLDRLYALNPRLSVHEASKREQIADNSLDLWQVSATANLSEPQLWALIERADAEIRACRQVILSARLEIVQRRQAERDARVRLHRAAAQ